MSRLRPWLVRALLARWYSAHGAALIHVSTDYVFDGTKSGAYTEDDAVGSLGVYGESKIAGGNAVREGLERHLIVRTSWLFSAHGSDFVKTIRRLAGERELLRVVADQHGRRKSAADLAGALWRITREQLKRSAPRAGPRCRRFRPATTPPQRNARPIRC